VNSKPREQQYANTGGRKANVGAVRGLPLTS